MSIQKDRVIAVRTNKIIYHSGDTVVKVFAPDFSKADILNEALNQARVEETGLNTPKILEVMKKDDRWAIVSEYIPGVTLQQLMDENPDKEDEYLERFVRLQMEIHTKRCPMLNRLTEKMQRKISASSYDATIRYELKTLLDGMEAHKKVCHGDFNPSNIIITPSDEAYIIDWAHVTQGNASADVARTYLLFWLEGKIDLAEKYIKLFCTLSDTARQYVQKWIPIVAASQSVKQKPEEREFLKHWVDVVDYE